MAPNPQTAATIAPEGTMTRNATVGEGSVLSKELRLSNGVTLSNRIAQSAMTEHLATGDGAPSWQLIEAYKRFAVSGAALIISGNVMVNGWSLEAPRNVVIEDEWHLPQLRHIRVVPRGLPGTQARTTTGDCTTSRFRSSHRAEVGMPRRAESWPDPRSGGGSAYVTDPDY